MGPDAKPSDCVNWTEHFAVVLKTGMEDYAWVHYDGCDGHGVDLGGSTRQLNAELMYWALPRGWSGGVDGSVPMPEKLRD